MRLVGNRAEEGSGALKDPLAYLDALHRLARHLVRGSAEAEDLVQETYARALRAAPRLPAGADLRAWLFRILRNAFLDGRRREARSPIDPAADGDIDAVEAVRGPKDGALRGDAELEVLRRVVGEEIEAALRALPEEGRTVVLLDLEGLAEEEIALVLGCPKGTVKSRLFRARCALRARLAEYRR
jgi:RNA polymerase sigma-70 factor (ECF subfamily)